MSHYDLDFEELPEGYVALEGIIIVKALDEDGDLTFLVRSTEGLNDMEVLGALTAFTKDVAATIIDRTI